MNTDEPLSIVDTFDCGHCGNRTTMSILSEAKYSQEEVVALDPSRGNAEMMGDVAYTWQVLRCHVCDKINVFRGLEFPWNDPSDMIVERLYPQSRRNFKNLPADVAEAWRVARRLLSVEPIASVVFVGRTIEYVCEDRKAKGKNLEDRIKDLLAKNEIPPKLAEMAQNSRLFRNFGAHATGIGSFSSEDASILCDFCEAILDYIYETPVMLQRMQRRVNELKQQEDKWKAERKSEGL